MKKIADNIYNKIDNAHYNLETETWWDKNSRHYILKSSINPLRVGYFKRILFEEMQINATNKMALEVGSGGGILTEEIAKMGFETSGIDPSEHSVQVAKNHSITSNLKIEYDIGVGEALPYADATFDVVFCCDVLEHVRDLPKVISEISRVLKPKGVFCFDTINRTLLSKLIVIKIMQEWKTLAFAPENLHVWEMFIQPKELESLLNDNDFAATQFMGSRLATPVFKMAYYLRQRAKGKLNYEELGEKLHFKEHSDKNVNYLGYAIKK
ncbi:MAG: bifunctional 2-polyprenyl-6-hydroxyphenol methylase/3-demethylubiquinol 3-O-methyltransferase UbiG [Chitinophagales bacterium]